MTSNNPANNYVIVIEIPTTLVTTVPLLTVGGTPNRLAITPDGTQVWVVNTGSGDVQMIDIPANTLANTVSTGGTTPHRLDFTSADGYVLNQVTSDMTIVDIPFPNTAAPPFLLGVAAPQSIAIAPDGATGYITTLGISALEIFDIVTLSIVGSIPLSAPASFGLVDITPDGKKAFLTQFGADTISRVDLSMNIATASAAFLSGPIGIAFLFNEVSGECVGNVFLTQVDLMNVITWNSVLSAIPLVYQIFRNGELIGVVPSSGPLEFKDFNRERNTTDVYSVYTRTGNNLALLGMVSVTACKK